MIRNCFVFFFPIRLCETKIQFFFCNLNFWRGFHFFFFKYTMLKTFFGCCPLRHGVSAIAIFNTVTKENIYWIIIIRSKRLATLNLFKRTREFHKKFSRNIAHTGSFKIFFFLNVVRVFRYRFKLVVLIDPRRIF